MTVSPDTSYTVPLLINGKEVTTTTTFTVTSPASHKDLWQSSSASLEHVSSAAEAAQAALPGWAKLKPSGRRAIFMKAADILEARASELAQYMEMETGAPSAFSSGFNVPKTADMLRDVAGRVGGIMGHIPTCEEEGTGALIVKEPFGVVLAIAPWNAPYILGLRSVLYPLAGGNTTIFKGSEFCPRTWWALGSVLTEAGLPAGVLNVLVHRPEDAAKVTTALIEHPAIKKINFTGSTAVGRIIASQAGKNLKPVLMELGGKASAIVLDDADLKNAATQCALGAFLNSGQICMSSERILVHKAIKPQFIDALKGAVEAIFGGDKPPLVTVTSAAITKNKKLVANALENGAKLIHGDHEKEELHPDTKEVSGTRMRPVIVDGVKKGMDLFYTESFGPSVSVIEIASDDEAVEIANDTEYGLSGAVFTENLARGLRIAKQIETGAVHINSMSVHDEASLPHGGAKASGFGRFNADWGIEEFLRTKTITYRL
ncbi:aldehyde dehydrogenase [Dothidotthia symphoricarpi CBS 119687]|uniref:Aldehyde dehydrogenase n=1 Tax=Dothidotthia symphoricarpi CBS 119687 TaxID=1392245 RepID=A0A6A5ZX79_9PLEO|nr:aldehyde dehydrogenase [Dothidotthia symphoricarpi CBS 119687]KAF2124362.1 aldehyde dehydrogenase [Dothidotthia symphoricarpi CBS 119687]